MNLNDDKPEVRTPPQPPKPARQLGVEWTVGEERARIREILQKEWDPLQVAGTPDEEGAYEECITPICGIMRHPHNQISILRCLFRLERKRLGVHHSFREWLARIRDLYRIAGLIQAAYPERWAPGREVRPDIPPQ